MTNDIVLAEVVDEDPFATVLANEARVNITWAGQNGDLAQPISVDATDSDIKSIVQEAVRNGTVPGISRDSGADFNDFVVDRFGPTEQVPFNRVMLRPKTPFGA